MARAAARERRGTYRSLHPWSQVVGKVRIARTPFVSHWRNCTFLVSPRGLSAPAMTHGERRFSIDFDLVAHDLGVETDDGARAGLALEPMAVADFHRKPLAAARPLVQPELDFGAT